MSDHPRASGYVSAVNGSLVDVVALGATLPGLPFPPWYAPQVGDSVIVSWLGSQPYIEVGFAGKLSSYTPSPWQSYTPALTAVTTDPSLGAGVALGAYQQSGKTVVYQGQIAFGSGMGAGSGAYRMSVPAPANTSRWPYRRVGTWTGLHAVTGGRAEGFVAFDSTTSFVNFYYTDAVPVGNLGVAGSAAPWAWAQSDGIDFTMIYEAA